MELYLAVVEWFYAFMWTDRRTDDLNVCSL